MSQPVQARVREFAESLLGRAGALVEWPPSAEHGLALLPPEAAPKLGFPGQEEVPLAFAPGGGGLCVNLATDFLDRVVPLLDAEPRIGAFQLPERYLKRGDMGEAIARAFTWHNAKVVVRGAAPERVGYHAWYFFASIVSEDRWEDVLSATVNDRSGAVVALPDPFRELFLEPHTASQGSPAETYRPALRHVLAQAEERAAPFAARLEARQGRDRLRLREYYDALLREENARRHRVWTPEVKAKQEARRRAVQLELERKLAELDETYALKGEITPIAVLRIEVQALAVQCEVYRKQARAPRTLYWNPITKELEPLACDACGASAFSIAFTDGDVRPLCAACARAHP